MLSASGLIRTKFDASGYLEQAIDREIIELAYVGWRGGDAMAVADFCASMGEFPALQAALDHVRAFPTDVLLVELHGPDALSWIREHRIDVVGSIESMMGRGSCDLDGLDRGPYWDDDPAWDCSYEHRRSTGGSYRPS